MFTPVLHLVGVACKARMRVGAHSAYAAAEATRENSCSLLQALRAHGGEILAGKRAAKAHSKPQHGKAVGDDVAHVARFHAPSMISAIKSGTSSSRMASASLNSGPQHKLCAVAFQIRPKGLHSVSPFLRAAARRARSGRAWRALRPALCRAHATCSV